MIQARSVFGTSETHGILQQFGARATLSVVPSIPVAGMALILGVDRFMSECRAITNFVGNAVATIVVARWEGELDEAMLSAVLDIPDATAETGRAVLNPAE